MDLETRRKILIPKSRLINNKNTINNEIDNKFNINSNIKNLNKINIEENHMTNKNFYDHNKNLNADLNNKQKKFNHMTSQKLNNDSYNNINNNNNDDENNSNNNISNNNSNNIINNNNSNNNSNNNINNNFSNSDDVINKSKEKGDKKKQNIKSPRHIKLLNTGEDYDITKDLLNTPSNISFAQLLDCSPRVRAELIKNLKLEKPDIVGAIKELELNALLVNNPNHDYISKYKGVNKDDIAITIGKVDDSPARLLVDSGSNVNIISKEFLKALPKEYPKLGVSKGRLIQAVGSSEYTEDQIVQLPIKIGNIEFEAPFRVVNSEDSYYDVIVGYYTQFLHKFFVISPLNAVYFLNDKLEAEYLCSVITTEMCNEEKLTCFIKKIDDDNNISSKNNTSLINDTDPYINAREYIYSEKFLEHVNPIYINEIIPLLITYIDVIATSADDLVPSLLSPHKIKLKDNVKPIKQHYYKLNNNIKTIILKKKLKELIEKRLIEPSLSEWSSPVVLVPKNSGDYRLCIDYRKVNDATIPDAYPLPYIDEIFASLHGATIFTTLDLFSGYHQILMDDDSVEITSFTTKFGNFVYKVMPFGLTNAPATFQREMNKILFDLIGVCVYVFLDDVLIYSKNKEDHLAHLALVLSIFSKFKLKINIEKCHFMMEEVQILGHVISKNGLSTMSKKVDAIKHWDKPTTITELRSFLGAVGYYRNFIESFSKVAAPLNKLLKKDSKFNWSDEQQNAFDQLKRRLVEAPILRFPDFTKPFIIRTDASGEGIGGVLLQVDPDDHKEHPIHYVSRTLTAAERRYGITDLEGVAVHYCVKQFKSYIEGNQEKTVVYTDHKPLVGLFSNKEPNNSRHARWCIDLSMLGVRVEYEKGKNNHLADSLSRLKQKNVDEMVNSLKIVGKFGADKNLCFTIVEENKVNEINEEENNVNEINVAEDNVNEINVAENNVNEINVEKNNVNEINEEEEENEEEQLVKLMKKFLSERIIEINDQKYFLDNGLKRRIITHEEEKVKLIWESHRIGHEGIEKTYQRLKRHFYWKNMIEDIRKTIKYCTKCQLNRPEKFPEPTERFATTIEGPFVHLGLDIIGPLPITERNNRFIIVTVDYFTKWVEAEPTPTITAKDIVYFLSKVFARHGTPQCITVDNGVQFVADLTKIFLDMYDVYIKFTTTYHPESNGLTENRNKEISKEIRLLGETNRDWDLILPSALWAIRTARNNTTKYSSFELLYGRMDQQPFELATISQTYNMNQSSEELLLEKFCDHYKWVLDAYNNMKNKAKKWEKERNELFKYNKQNEIKEGDLVKIRNFNRFKLDPYFTGPFQVTGNYYNTVSLMDPNSEEKLERPVHLKNVIKIPTTSE